MNLEPENNPRIPTVGNHIRLIRVDENGEKKWLRDAPQGTAQLTTPLERYTDGRLDGPPSEITKDDLSLLVNKSRFASMAFTDDSEDPSA